MEVEEAGEEGEERLDCVEEDGVGEEFGFGSRRRGGGSEIGIVGGGGETFLEECPCQAVTAISIFLPGRKTRKRHTKTHISHPQLSKAVKHPPPSLVQVS